MDQILNKRSLRVLAIISFHVLSILCDAPFAEPVPVNVNRFRPIDLPIEGKVGIFDPSLANTEPGSPLWMSYTAINPSSRFPEVNTRTETTRLAYSLNQGASWQDLGVLVNDVSDYENGKTKATWVNEVSSLVYDRYAEPNLRWQLYWHHYRTVGDHGQFENGWIGFKGASTPEQLAYAQEVKLFAGRAYNTDNNRAGVGGSPLGGAPIVQVNSLSSDLEYCVAITEPGSMVTSSGIYVAMTCLEPKVKNPIGLWGMGMFGAESMNILLKCEVPCHPANYGAWRYLGTFLSMKDAKAFDYVGFSAPDLFLEENQAYLLISPQSNIPVNDAYNGCWLMYFSDLDKALLARIEDGRPRVLKKIGSPSTEFTGACTYQPSGIQTGYLFGEVKFRPKPSFQILQTGSDR